MENEHKEEKKVKGSIFMEVCKPVDLADFPHQGMAGEDFQSHQEKEHRTTKSQEVVGKHSLWKI